MIVIPSTEIPASLRGTLQGTQYKGWENGTIYRNQSSDMFMVEVREGNQTKTYRFDQNGKASQRLLTNLYTTKKPEQLLAFLLALVCFL